MADAPDSLADLRRDLSRALKLMAAKAPDYRKAREYYDGTRAEIAGSATAASIIQQSKETPVSFAHIPVDVIVEKVQLTSLTAAGEASAATLQEWAEANDFDDEVEDWTRQAGIYGDYYVVTDPLDEDEETGAASEVDTVGLSPFAAIVIYDKKTRRVAEYGAHVWDVGTEHDPRTKAILHYDDATVRLVTRSGKSDDADDYVFDVPAGADKTDAIVPHEGGRMLLRHLAVGGKPYGVPLHRRAWGFQDAITKISANNLVNVDAQGLPARWALLDPAAEIDDDIDDDFGTDGPGTIAAKSDGLTEATRGKVRALPGAIQMLRGVKATGTYETGSSEGFLKNLDWYVRGMAVATGVALFEFDLNGEQPSGEARRRAEGRANRRAESVQRQVRGFLIELAETVLGVTGAADAEIEVDFAPIQTSTDAEGIALVAEKVKVGVPIRTALAEAGYTAEQIDEWFPANETARLSPALLSVIAEVLSKLGTAQTLGVIQADEVRAMLPDILTLARGEGPLPEATELPADADPATELAQQVKAKADALGALIRSGADPEQAAAAVETGDLSGLAFPNVPVTVRIPEAEATGLEGAGASAPEPPAAE